MSFQRKSAWISLFYLTLFGASWITHVLGIEFFHATNDNPMRWFFGMLAGLIALDLPSSSRFMIAQCVMGSIIFAALVRFGAQIALYRRDA